MENLRQPRTMRVGIAAQIGLARRDGGGARWTGKGEGEERTVRRGAAEARAVEAVRRAERASMVV